MTRISSILFWFTLIIVASLGLYRTSDRVQELEQQLRETNAAIDAEKESLHVLNAEWVYFTNPARIEATAKRHLSLRATSPQQVATLDTLSEIVPTRSESMATVAVNATPMATIKTTLTASAPIPPAVSLSHVGKPKPLALASIDTGHLRDHMLMVQHTASAAPLPGDSIGTLITQLNSER